jgi:2-aminoethylphosphonate-pyruvate transaminase
MKNNVLLTPGPVTTSEEVKESLIVPDICPREKEFGNVMKSICTDLVKISGGDRTYTTILLLSSGTGAMEAVANCIQKDEKVLVISNGSYGERFRDILQRREIRTYTYNTELGKNLYLKNVETLLNSGAFSFVVVAHHETSTGILNPINEIGELCNRYNCSFIIDAISSFGGTELNVKKCNADFIIATSNKCLEGFPGLSFVICKKDRLREGVSNSEYFDLYEQYKYFKETGQMRFTAPVQIIYAFRKALDNFFTETQKKRIERYHLNHAVLTDGMKKRGFKLLLPNDVEHSKLLETYHYPTEDFDFDRFHDLLKKKGFTIYPGKLLNKKVFRLGNIGHISYEDIKNFLREVDNVLKEMK